MPLDSYYRSRSAATSPLHNLTTPALSLRSSVVSNEDFGESDDELRREDILFPNEAGEFMGYSFIPKILYLLQFKTYFS